MCRRGMLSQEHWSMGASLALVKRKQHFALYLRSEKVLAWPCLLGTHLACKTTHQAKVKAKLPNLSQQRFELIGAPQIATTMPFCALAGDVGASLRKESHYWPVT